MGVTGGMNFKNPRPFFSESGAPGFLRPVVDIQELILTFKTLPWLLLFPQRPDARFEEAMVPIELSLVQ